MPLVEGTRIGSYEIVAKLGEGGMGAVYRARDTKLNRDVAIKVLLPEVAGAPDRVARFAREAQVLAALNHPNIAAVIGIEEHSEAGPCIVMEMVTGRDLAEILMAGPLPLPDTLAIAKQIAEALEAAHDAGLVHRDLKPANVKVRDDGTVKILDFGLAKPIDGPASGSQAHSHTMLANSPTMAPAAQTQPGLILGTVAYMSPEQAKAQRLDKRTDIWAFGVIVHEMLTGRNPFQAETMSEVLAAVLTRPVDVADLPAGTPQRLRTLIRRCLSRDQKQRLRDIGDARLIIDEMLAGTPDAEPSGITQLPATPPAWRQLAPWAIAAVAIVAATMIAMLGSGAATTDSRVVTRTATAMPTYSLFVALSPDGRNLAFSTVVGGTGFSILLRPLDRLEARPIAGTEDGRMPVFSPDGRSIAFFTLRNGGTIRRVSIAGGDAIDIGPGFFPNGAAWGDDNTIVFAGFDGGLMRVPANGGKPEPLTTLEDDARAHTRPQFLPGNRLLFTIRRKSGSVEFAVLDNGATRVIAPGGDNGRFIASGLGDGVGHLVFGRDETLFALPFDINRLEPVGAETLVVERVSRNGPLWNSDYTVSKDGLLIYSRSLADDEVSLAWTSSSGAVSTIDLQTQIARPRLSPDGRYAAGQLVGDSERIDIAVADLTRGATTRLTSSGSNSSPVWTPDGRRIVFGGVLEQKPGIYVTEADGSGAPRLLFAAEAAAYPLAITPDGRTLLYSERQRFWMRALDGSGQSRPLHESRAGNEIDADVSPDGKWIVYTTDESDRSEAYVHEFPGPGRRERVSTNGAQRARWTENGRAIVYWDPVGQTGNMNVMRVPVETAPRLQLGAPAVLFSQVAPAQDVTADGTRFLGFAVKGGQPTTLVLVTNWFDELRARAPISR